MKQVLVDLPIPGLGDVPIYGFGMMLFLSFVACTAVLARRSRQEGVPADRIQDFALWVFFAGIVGARITYIQTEGHWRDWYRIWDGGLVFYGSILGGALGALLGYHLILKQHRIALSSLADMLAPAIALGICLGRLGCFLNGCCYGQVNCADHAPSVHFPLASPPRIELTRSGMQSAAGFTMVPGFEGDGRRVSAVESDSAADRGGLQRGDLIVQVGPQEIRTYAELDSYLAKDWPRGKNELELTVLREGKQVQLEPFSPRTIGLHPTQLYSSFGGLLLFLLTQTFYPLRPRQGAVLGLLMLAYPVERFLEEMLRSDNPPLSWGLTFSQNVSVYLFLAGVLFTLWLWWQPAVKPQST